MLWLLWTFFSETRHNHGILVAFLIPLSPLIILFMYLILWSIQIVLFTVYVLRGKREEYPEAIRKIKVRSGFLMLL